MLERLNEIIHPAVKRYIRRQLELKRQQGQKICVVEAALLLEDHYQEFCDTIWYIHTDEEIRIRRLMENRGYTRREIHKYHCQARGLGGVFPGKCRLCGGKQRRFCTDNLAADRGRNQKI